MSTYSKDEVTTIAYVIGDSLVSANESDRNGESANVVDGLFAIARALEDVARAIASKGAPGDEDDQ